ncbi:MAG: hypothetical protein MPK62_02305 [Alphaproteobacteria bacterium]|nr:hypothetical protein [Alphaproteobacteria bacterium]MDA8029967.1 hypothetical protein [Alphaproteobacteria bacterium]
MAIKTHRPSGGHRHKWTKYRIGQRGWDPKKYLIEQCPCGTERYTEMKRGMSEADARRQFTMFGKYVDPTSPTQYSYGFDDSASDYPEVVEYDEELEKWHEKFGYKKRPRKGWQKQI